ncbi:putative lipid phosphate phosphatase 3, chloroplastic [Sesamum angolense]|uniref:Lipid phosphate phosphatase 3, chloroplastic n=1 Tax=Sesamum angolense TaxID=2727404 RepID=A0AAE1WUS1_9LAMI|nr:putative lipid phosphate phosphatase 3, chloroplastic [Sesamum angolense]
MFQVNSNEVELGCQHTIKSHGGRVARNHKHDWLILILLVVIDIILNIIHPFYRFVGQNMMTDLKYPMKDNTVPIWAVPLADHGPTLLALFPDGIDKYDRWGDVVCHGKASDIKEGHKSFPSGHASWSFAGLGFLALYLSGKIKCFDRRGHVAKLCIIFLPILAACLVGISRVDDYWHHWQDVFAGGLLGLTVATFCYLQFFPPPYHTEGWGTYAYFRALEEVRPNPGPVPPRNGISMQGMNHQSSAVPVNTNVVDQDLDTSFDAMESGRR